jgi:multidrug/hemolysin transport system permease protein
MSAFASRNIKIFFRDKSTVFFSLLAVFIIIGLYALFLGDVWTNSLSELTGVRFIMDSWITAGLLAVMSVTTTMGAFGVMVDDKVKKLTKDFYSAPVSRSAIAGGYILSAYLVGIIMSLVTLALCEIYIVLNGGELLGLAALLETLGLIVLSTFAGTSLVLFIVSFFKSQNAYAAASTVIGTVIGFLTGIYIPIGSLPSAVQFVVKLFPISHSALLLRNVVMRAPVTLAFENVPAEYAEDFRSTMGMTFTLGGHTVSTAASVLVLLLSGVLFFCLALINLSRKNK